MLIEVFVNSIVAGSAYALVAIGFSSVYSVSKNFHFAHAAVYTSSAYIYYFSIAQVGLKWWLAVPIAIGGACLIGGGIEKLIYHPLRRHSGSQLAMLVSSLGVLVLLQNLISLCFGNESKTVRGAQISQTLRLWVVTITPIRLCLVSTSWVVVCGLSAVYRHTRFGKQTRAVANDPHLASIVGIRPEDISLKVMILGSGVAALVSVLQSYDTDINPLMGFNILLMGVAAAIIGGVGSIPGAALGGLLIGLAQNFGAWLLPTQWQDTVVFVTLLVFLIARPRGFFGRPLKKSAV